MKKIFKIAWVSVTVILFQACSDDFLDQEYENALVDVNFFQTPAHADQAVIGIYDVLGFQGQYIWTRTLLGSSTADDVVEDHGDAGWPDWIALDKFTFNAENRFFKDHWNSCYSGIMRANYVIQRVPGIEGMDENLTKRYVAEAKALRALFYYNLVTAFGDVPLYLEPITLEQSKEATRDPELEIWAQILEDLNAAKADLPDTYPANEAGRATKGFANAMLSRVYLWTKEYDKAAQAAQAVVNSPSGYGLEANLSDIYDGTIETGKESILDVMNATGSPNEYIWQTGSEVSETNRIFYWGPFFSWSHFFQPSRDFIDNVFETGDIRRKVSVLDMRAGDKYDLNNDGDDSDPIPANPPVDAHIMKYVPKNQDLTSSEVNGGAAQWVNIHIMRYAEVLLNYAEALNEQDKPDDALPYLNQVRNRAGLASLTKMSKEALRDAILHERAVEFCFEGHRFFDLKRAGKLAEVLGQYGFRGGIHEVFPVPQAEIDLSKMTQNTGY